MLGVGFWRLSGSSQPVYVPDHAGQRIKGNSAAIVWLRQLGKVRKKRFGEVSSLWTVRLPLKECYTVAGDSCIGQCYIPPREKVVEYFTGRDGHGGAKTETYPDLVEMLSSSRQRLRF